MILKEFYLFHLGHTNFHRGIYTFHLLCFIFYNLSSLHVTTLRLKLWENQFHFLQQTAQKEYNDYKTSKSH